MKLRTEIDFDSRMNSYNKKRELGERTNRMHELQEASTKEIRHNLKEKFRAKLETFEIGCSDKIRRST